MDRFWDLLEKSTIVSGLIALGITYAIIYMTIAGFPIPEIVGNAALIIIGFFFGAKTQAQGSRSAQASGKGQS